MAQPRAWGLTHLTWWRRLWRSPLNRLACFFSLAFLITYLLITTVTVLGVIRQTQRARSVLINAEIEGLDQIYEDEDIPGLISAINERVRTPRDAHAVYALFDASGKIIAGQFAQLPVAARRAGWVSFDVASMRQAKGQAQIPTRHIEAYVQVLEENERLLAGRDTSEQRAVFARAYQLGIAALIVLALAAVAFAYGFRRAIDTALRAPLDTVNRFSMGRLSERVARNGSQDSFDQLSATLNEMLDRIQDLFNGIVHSTDAIAHDLRTPLSRLRTHLENLRVHANTPEANDHVETAIREAEQLLARFSALLRLARIESVQSDSASQSGHELLDLAEIARDADELWRPLAEEKLQSVAVLLHSAQIYGDRDQLFQLISNLLDNAIKYTPSGGRILLLVTVEPRQTVLRVQDSGPGIARSDHVRVFDRFVRLDADRSTPGFGLGLSLVRAIALRHKATIQLTDAAPGLCIEIRFTSQ